MGHTNVLTVLSAEHQCADLPERTLLFIQDLSEVAGNPYVETPVPVHLPKLHFYMVCRLSIMGTHWRLGETPLKHPADLWIRTDDGLARWS